MFEDERPNQKRQSQYHSHDINDFKADLGGVMRGERATLGKSLMDVQRDLRIEAKTLHAIEQGDILQIDNHAYIPGMVRAYAQYLGLDPEWAYEKFCHKTGYVAERHGLAGVTGSSLSTAATPETQTFASKKHAPFLSRDGHMSQIGDDAFENLTLSPAGYATMRKPFLPKIDFSFFPSIFGLIALLAILGYGAWYVLENIQKIEIIPSETVPTATFVLDTGENMRRLNVDIEKSNTINELYKSNFSDARSIVLRDNPIGKITHADVNADPRAPILPDIPTPPEGHFVSLSAQSVQKSSQTALVISPQHNDNEQERALYMPTQNNFFQNTPLAVREVIVVAVRPVWVQVRARDGSSLYEKVMSPGEHYIPPKLSHPAILKVGQSDAIYFRIDGKDYGPVGEHGKLTSGIVLSADKVVARFPKADVKVDPDLAVAIVRLLLNQRNEDVAR